MESKFSKHGLTVIFILFFLVPLFWFSACKAQEKEIDLSKKSGLVVIEDFSGVPDSMGILKEIPLDFPAFSKGGYFAGDGGGQSFLAGNRNHLWLFDQSFRVLNEPVYGPGAPYYLLKSPAGQLGSLTILELPGDRYLCMLPLAGSESLSWIEFNEGRDPILKAGSLGKAPVRKPLPLLAWASSDNLYEACYLTWQKVLESGIQGVQTTWRSKKPFPEVFQYLGWCSWEEFRSDINDSILTTTVQKIKDSEVPVRFVLVDDGHQWADRTNNSRMLKSFSPDPIKFPHGWRPLISMKDPGNIKWMGLWHHQSGYFQGLAAENDFGKLNDHLTRVESGAYLPALDKASINVFYSKLFGSVKRAGFDFTKIDFQSSNFRHYIGEDNAVRAHAQVAGSMEASVHRLGLELLNCIAQDMVSVLNTRYSNVTRCSQDYRKGNISNARIHIYQSYNNLLWMGHTVWGDHDMFHSSDRICGRLMAVSKAMSGGPVYLSDHPNHFLREYIDPLCYSDGEIIRPLAPAVPLPESVFNNPMHEKASYRVIAPLPNGAASVVCYNLFESSNPETLESVVKTLDYKHSSALMQPYPGPRELPSEGLIIYDWYGGEIIPGKEHHFVLSGLSDRLFHLCPVEKGVAVIGRTDKYLSPATVSDVQVKSGSPGNKILSFTMKESAPFAIYLDEGIPSADQVTFEKGENGLWTGIPPDGIRNFMVQISISK